MNLSNLINMNIQNGHILNLYSHYSKQDRGSSKKLKIECQYDSAIPLLGIYLKEIKPIYPRDSCLPAVTVTSYRRHRLGIKQMGLYLYSEQHNSSRKRRKFCHVPHKDEPKEQ